MKHILFILLLSFSLGFAKQEPNNLIPNDISKVLKSSFPGWRILSTKDLSPTGQELWEKSKKNYCPGIASGKFLNARNNVFALLLIHYSHKSPGYKVVVFIPSKKGQYKPIIIEDWKKPITTDVVIYCVPPGIYSDPEDIKKVNIKTDAIQIEWMEVGLSVYFWNNNHFENLITSD